MPTRLWSDAQRERYERPPAIIDDEDIARCFHLDERDRTLIAALRGGHNRLGFALQLGAVRFIGVFPSETDGMPAGVIGTLAGQLGEQDTHVDPDAVMTGTVAYSDVVFGLFWLLGYRSSPRLADIGGARLWRIDRKADYGAFNRLSRNKVDTDLIIAAWPDLLRLAGSLELGRIKADAVMRILQVKERLTPLARALAELGRIIKTIHVLDYVDDADKRRRILVQLNKQEFRHRLARIQ